MGASLPLGAMKTRDGRSFRNAEPARLVELFRQGGIDLPIDYEHQNDRPEAKRNGPVPAAGWIKALELRADGLWGRVDWTARARELIGNREYRFLSPSLRVEKATHRVLKLKGAGLVHNPALNITALASQEDQMADDLSLMQRVAALLDLPEDTGEADVLAALKKRLAEAGQPDPRKYVPVEALQDIMRERAQNTATMSEEQARPKVDVAFRSGYLTTAMKPWAMELCQADEVSFDAFIKTTVPSYKHLLTPCLPSAPPGTANRVEEEPEVLALCEQLGLTPETFRQ